ncbi:hypothetical protein CR513_61211, partial [Mucuna pruriens]
MSASTLAYLYDHLTRIFKYFSAIDSCELANGYILLMHVDDRFYEALLLSGLMLGSLAKMY